MRLSGSKFEILYYCRMMNKEVADVGQLYLNEPKLALDFLVEHIGFVIYAASKNANSVKVCDSYGNLYELFLNTMKNEDSTNKSGLIINTTDCLQDFYDMERKGISISTKPHYVAEGLVFEISDYWNNRYTFLEKRDYTDQ